jgi:hypothetical protein
LKLLKLKSIAHNALRDTMWTPVTLGSYPFEGTAMAQWFREVFEKEGIPMNVIESATVSITPESRKWEIKAQGRIFVAAHAFD